MHDKVAAAAAAAALLRVPLNETLSDSEDDKIVLANPASSSSSTSDLPPPVLDPLTPPANKNLKRTYASQAISCSGDAAERAIEILSRRKRQRLRGDVGGGDGFRRRGLKKRKRHWGFLGKLCARETGDIGMEGIRQLGASRVFKNMKGVKVMSTWDSESFASRMPWLRSRTSVTEIIGHEELIFALTHAGMCAAFDSGCSRRLCFLNKKSGEVIISLFLNKKDDSIITVSVFNDDDFSSLRCRSTALQHIRQGEVGKSVPLFETESLKWPGFVEFDEINSKVLTFSVDKTYKVWDLTTYKCLYTISDEGIQEIKISKNVMLLVHCRSISNIRLRIIEIETGELLKDFTYLLHRNRNIHLIELFNDKLLVKQEHENLQIYDLKTSKVVNIPKSQFLTPSAFIFLYESQLFLTLRHRQVSLWNCKGELVTSFEDHTLWHPGANTNTTYITKRQDLLMSYCKADDSQNGSINISWIHSGKSVAKIPCSFPVDLQSAQFLANSGPSTTRAEEEEREGHVTEARQRLPGSGEIAPTLFEGLIGYEALSGPDVNVDNVTSLYYHEPRNEIYAGMSSGRVFVWSN